MGISRAKHQRWKLASSLARGAASMAVLCFAVPAHALLVPTPVNVGDCVADRISVPYSPERAPYDLRYCREGNPADVSAYQVCLHNRSLHDTPFFTDRCGDGTEFYLAVNGVEHVLQRVGLPWLGVNLSGRFAGDGLELEVLPLEQSGQPGADAAADADASEDSAAETDTSEDAESGSWSVQITLRRGGETRTFEATLVYGP